jgi:hypothetical protein
MLNQCVCMHFEGGCTKRHQLQVSRRVITHRCCQAVGVYNTLIPCATSFR